MHPAEHGDDLVRRGRRGRRVATGSEVGGAHAVPTRGLQCAVGAVLPVRLPHRQDQRPDKFAVGEKVDAKITAVDRAARRLSLTVKGKEIEEEREAVKEFGTADSGASLGDILGAAIRRRREMAGEE